MRTRVAGLAAGLAVLVAPLIARANTPGQCIALWSGLAKAGQAQGLDQQAFMAACLAHRAVLAAPAPDSPPAGATGRCHDGAYTSAAVPLAGCDRHGGLAGLLGP